MKQMFLLIEFSCDQVETLKIGLDAVYRFLVLKTKYDIFDFSLI